MSINMQFEAELHLGYQSKLQVQSRLRHLKHLLSINQTDIIRSYFTPRFVMRFKILTRRTSKVNKAAMQPEDNRCVQGKKIDAEEACDVKKSEAEERKPRKTSCESVNPSSGDEEGRLVRWNLFPRSFAPRSTSVQTQKNDLDGLSKQNPGSINQTRDERETDNMDEELKDQCGYRIATSRCELPIESIDFEHRKVEAAITDAEGTDYALSQQRRKLSYTELVQVRSGSTFRKQSQNFVDYLALESKGAPYKALIAESDGALKSLINDAPTFTTTEADNARYDFADASKSNDGRRLAVESRKDGRRRNDRPMHPIDILSKNSSTSAKSRRKRPSYSYEPNKILENAIKMNYVELAKGLVESNQINTNKLNNEGFAPLHQAAFENRPEIIQILLDNEAYIDILDASGFSPLDIAVSEGCFDCAEILIRHGADQSSVRDGCFNDRSIARR